MSAVLPALHSSLPGDIELGLAAGGWGRYISVCTHGGRGTPGSSRDGISGRRFHEDFWGSREENGKVSFSCKIEFIRFKLQVSLESQAGKKGN